MGSHSTRNAYLMLFYLCYVNFISFPSLSHKPLLMRYSVSNKCLKNETYSLLSFLCVTCMPWGHIFNPILSFQREQNYACRLWLSFCVMLKAKSHKFCKICRSALEGGISKKFSIFYWKTVKLTKNRKFCKFGKMCKPPLVD